VPNPSFEDTVNCSGPFNSSNIEIATPWFNPNGATSDLFTDYLSCGYNLSQANQVPRTGYSIAGLYGYFGNNNREYIEVELIDSLQSQHLYCVGFYVSRMELCGGAIDKIGAFLSQDSLKSTSLINFNVLPQIESASGNLLNDTSNWFLISGYYNALGGEKFLTIGNFRDSTQTFFQIIDTTTFNCQHAYYLIDDVFVYDCTVGLEEMTELNIQIHPNPATSQLKISFPNSNAFILEVYDMSGKLVYKNHKQPGENNILISTIDFADGLYLLRYDQGKQSGKSKFVIQH